MARTITPAWVAALLAGAAAVAPVHAADGPIKLGFGMAETGGLAGNGKAAVFAIETWANDVNAKGGLLGRKVELIHYDDQSNPSLVPGIYTKLLDVDKVDLVLSGYGTNQTAPAMPIVMQHDMLFLSNFALAVNDEFHYDKYFQIQPNGPDARHEFARSFLAVAAMLDPKPKTIALVGADAEYPQAALSGARDNLRNTGYKVVYDKTYPPNTVDYTPIVRAIQATNPDAVFIASYPPDSAGFVRAINEVGMKPKLLGGGMVGLQFAALKTQFGPLLNGIVNFEQYVPSPTMKMPETEAFLVKYQAKAAGLGIDQLGLYLPPYAYAGAQVYEQAITAVGSLDQAKLARYIHGHKFQTIVGEIEFAPDGEWATARILQTQFRDIKDNSLDTFKKVGTQIILYPAQYKSGDVIPYDQAKNRGMPAYLVGVDIGGTFTDCVVIDEHGTVTTAKSPSTPDDFARGMLDAMAAAAAALGTDLDGLCRQTVLLSHGTTIGTNAIVQQRGAPVGLITTKGHNDVIHIMRGSRGITGRDIQQVVHFPESAKPGPIVPKRLIEGVSERVDCFGEVVVPLNEEEAEAAIHRLVAKGVKAIAICFLWSFRHPAHERRVKALVQKIAPDLFVTCSADLVPKWGEYERVTAVALNGYIGPLTSTYLRNLDRQIKARGYAHPLQITQCGGGTISVEKAIGAPLLTLDSGVAGVTGSQYLGDLMGCPNIITTDMGGTSFDVGIIFDGKPAYSFVSNTHQYEYFLPKVDIQAIGSGGGSLVRVDPATRTMRVGPESAGAVPGPACYGRGGTTATVTDADVVLGYLDPDNFAGGKIKLDKAAAVRAVQAVADQLGLSLVECASGIAKIAEFQMADIIRKMTVQKGFDPRDFVLFAFGGAGPAHAGVFAGELGVARVIVPQKKTASTWCAFGAASAHILHIHEQVDIQASPFLRERVNGNLAALESTAREQMQADGIAPGRLAFQFSIDMRHKGQINEVEVVLPASRLPVDFHDDLADRFFARYEQLYGKSSSFRGSRLEMVTFRLRASAQTPQPKLVPTTDLTDRIPDAARRGSRAIWWDGLKRTETTPIFDGALLKPGNVVPGPTVIETTDTTVVVHPSKTLRVDAFGNFEIDLKG